MVIKRKNYSGYEIPEGLEYISAQVGDSVAENVLDPADKLMEYYDKSPIQSRKVTGIRKVIKPLSYLLKRKDKRDKKK